MSRMYYYVPDIATRCCVCLDNSGTRYNYIELGIDNLIEEYNMADTRFGKSELICIKCMNHLLTELKRQRTLAARRILFYRIAGRILSMNRPEHSEDQSNNS